MTCSRHEWRDDPMLSGDLGIIHRTICNRCGIARDGTVPMTAPYQALRDARLRADLAEGNASVEDLEDGYCAVLSDDLAALLAERDALAAVAEAGLDELACQDREFGMPTDGLDRCEHAAAVRAALAAYDRAVSKP